MDADFEERADFNLLLLAMYSIRSTNTLPSIHCILVTFLLLNPM